MASYALGHKIGLRPHTKTHKSVRLAAIQLGSGAIGLTVAKVGEAEVMATAGERPDLLMAYPPVEPTRCERLARLAHEHTIRVALDSSYAAQALALACTKDRSCIGVLVDLDVGMGRTGLQTPDETLALAQEIKRTKGLRLDGIMIYPGHVWGPPGEQEPWLKAIGAKVRETLDLWTRHGLEAKIVSGGSTPTAFQSHHIPQLTEIRPGTYIFNDMNTVRGGFCSLEDCAARFVCTVVSDAVPGQVVIDAGSKTFTQDRCIPAPESGHGHVVEYPEGRITALSEEHGQVDVRNCPTRPKIGERVTVIPNHVCPCVNLQDVMWWDEGAGELEPLTVDARGKLS
jgi:D-serine deaminase-like pyridoxal phosphate-dependent protein